MDNNKIDEILKEKFKNTISPSKEFEDKIKEKINEEVKNYQKTSKPKSYKKVTSIISVAAVAVIVCTVGINLSKNPITDPKLPYSESFVTIKAIEPTKLESGILAKDSEFIVYAEGENISKEDIQKSIYIEPALDYTIEKTSNKNEYKLKFNQNIPDNTIVKLQYIKDKITENSWAYQTTDKLSVVNTYPNSNATDVSKNTAIEVEFSYASVEDFEKFVSITPKVSGKWEHLGKVWRFKADKEFEENQKYTVKINKGIVAENQKIEDDYMFSFDVNTQEGTSSKYEYITKSIDKINTYKSDEPIKIYYQSYLDNSKDIAKVEISKFSSTDEFIKYLENNEYQNAKLQGEYKFSIQNIEIGKYIQLNNTLDNGYYVASIKNNKGKEIFNCPIQINKLSAYAMQSQNDVLVWVGDNTGLLQNVNVKYSGKEQKTDKNGIIKFENIIDNSETIKYALVGNDENKLVVGLYNYNNENYPQSYIYTDRPLYKNTDTVKVWGFVPLQLFSEKVKDEFYIEFNGENKKKIKVNEDGSFEYEIKLENYIDNPESYVQLYYKDSSIAVKNIVIKNYELQNYNYKIIKNRNYAYVGENYEFDVKVEHITGLAVPNKSVLVKVNDKEYRGTTKEDGIAHFSVKIQASEYADYSGEMSAEPRGIEICAYNGDLEEYNDADNYTDIYVIHRNTYTKMDFRDGKNKGKGTIYKLAKEKNVNVDYELSKIYDGTYDTQIQVNLKETVTKRVIKGYSYDEYTKKDEPEYEYVTTENVKEIAKINSVNGFFEFDTTTINKKVSNEETKYSYTLEYKYKDLDGRTVKEEEYLYDEYSEQNTEGYFYDGISEGGQGSSDYIDSEKMNIHESYYYTYRYLLKKDVDKFSIGDKVNFTLAECAKQGINEIKNEGKLLTINLQENINKIDVTENDKFSYTFAEKDFPGCKITSAYFYKGKFYRMPIYYFDFKEQDRKVDIEIKSDKEQYKPGEEVTLSIKTTNNGKPVSGTVNISVVNEAVFNLQEDETNILEQIYTNKIYPIYTYSSYADYLDAVSGGAGGGNGGPRGEFGDTAYFKTLTTDSKGEVKVRFKLPDNVTTYRATVHSANSNLYVGTNSLDITSKLDFFIQSIEPRKVKTEDDLVLNATSIANENYEVEYEFKIKELNKVITTKGTTNKIATVNFGKMPYGTYHAIITGKYGNYVDSIEYEFDIIQSSQEVATKQTVQINQNVKIKPVKNPVVIEIYNKDMKQYLDYIDFIEKTQTQRLDTEIAYNKIIEFKNKIYGTKTSISKINDINIFNGDNYLKNLPNGKEDKVLTALAKYYARDYTAVVPLNAEIKENDNIFEVYLNAAAENKSVLLDLQYLKEEKEISNYNKLLVTLSLEFLGDFPNAKDLYKQINLSAEEMKEYKSIVALINTFRNKSEASKLINEIIEQNPADEYVRFAIISLLNNSYTEINEKSEVKVTSKNLNETVSINKMEVKQLSIYNEDLSEINFETDNNDLMVTYYYQELLDNIEKDNVSKDIKISLKGDLKKNNEVKLVVEFKDNKERNLKINLPNALRLALNNKENKDYYVRSNNIDSISVFKFKGNNKIEIPLVVTLEGNYIFENVVSVDEGIYSISNSLNLNIK